MQLIFFIRLIAPFGSSVNDPTLQDVEKILPEAKSRVKSPIPADIAAIWESPTDGIEQDRPVIDRSPEEGPIVESVHLQGFDRSSSRSRDSLFQNSLPQIFDRSSSRSRDSLFQNSLPESFDRSSSQGRDFQNSAPQSFDSSTQGRDF